MKPNMKSINVPENGTEVINNLLNVFVEGISLGIYTDLESVVEDAKQYMYMKEAVEKLSKWGKDNKVSDLVEIFDGIQRSLEAQRRREEEEKELKEIQTMPSMDFIGEENVK